MVTAGDRIPGSAQRDCGGLSMFVLGALLEAGQLFSPGRAVELGM
jgi:VanZ family protein